MLDYRNGHCCTGKHGQAAHDDNQRRVRYSDKKFAKNSDPAFTFRKNSTH